MNKKNTLFKRLYLMHLIVLLPLVIFGFYKNGIHPYQKGLVDFLNMFKPLIILVLGGLGALIGGIIREAKKGEKIDGKILDKCKGNILEAVLMVSILPLKSSPLVVFGVTLLTSLFLNKLKINRIVLEYITIEGINVLFGLNGFFNAYEESTVLNYNGLDMFFGFGSGGIFATSAMFIFVALAVLSFNKLYKKEMAISSVVTFLILGIVPNMIIGDYSAIFPYIFGYNSLFVLVFVGPNLYSSSYTIKGQILSGVLIGILTYGFAFFTPYTAAVLAVLVVSFLKGILDRIFVIK